MIELVCRRILLGFLLFMLLGPAASAGNPPVIDFHKGQLIIRTLRGDALIDIEIAETPEQQERGLMYRSELDGDKGMLFVFKEDKNVHMWMKNTEINLDMLFIDAHGKIVYIAHSVPAFSEKLVSSGYPVHAVLELPDSMAAIRHIHVGDYVIHSYFAP